MVADFPGEWRGCLEPIFCYPRITRGMPRRLENEKNSSIYKDLSSLRLVTDYHMGYPFRLAASPRLRRRPSPLRGTTSGTRSAGPGSGSPTDGPRVAHADVLRAAAGLNR
jgi:hypothetical protein